MFDAIAYPEALAQAGRVLASPFWLLLVLSVVAWRYGDLSSSEENEVDGDPAE